MSTPPRIQVYCTVRENEIQDGPEGPICTRCMKTLVDLADPVAVAAARPRGNLGCGFLRKVSLPVIASSLLLSSPTPARATDQPAKEAPPAPERPILRGKVAQPNPPASPEKKPEPSKDNPPPSRDIFPGEAPTLPEHAKLSSGGKNPENYPLAKAASDRPGIVISPYTGKDVDVVDLPSGSMVCDPAYPMKAKKYFRLP